MCVRVGEGVCEKVYVCVGRVRLVVGGERREGEEGETGSEAGWLNRYEDSIDQMFANANPVCVCLAL